MKISTSVREVYNEKEPLYRALKAEADRIIATFKRPNWHYESRVKGLESFALKAETGRFNPISELEDFFGGCLVVENTNAIKLAEAEIKKRFTLVTRRPRDPKFTHKDPSSFVFDDLRLYVSIPTDEMLPEKATDEVTFELQIKTFLQHAWSIATHDLVYKGGELNWSSNRIAYQVKAMLEHAELSISAAETMSFEHEVETNKEYKQTNFIINQLKTRWNNDLLPNDIIRLSSNILALLKSARLTNGQFKELCDESKFIGTSPATNLSPFLAIVLSILEYRPEAVDNLATGSFDIFIPPEVIEVVSNEPLERLQGKLIQPA